ncbi:MAG: type II toxin-antitoxin system VapC family toxin [Thermodesulfobacteriota bacterium]|nr:type II toxin-antitoxin system VapC family toxin [Thermodesulfobacteriota bacterium]
MKEITEQELSKALEGFSEEYSKFNTKKVGAAVLTEAETLINRLGKTLGLRALDSIHLATFNLFSELEEMVFVAADDVLLHAAQSIGAKAINPNLSTQIILPELINANDQE